MARRAFPLALAVIAAAVATAVGCTDSPRQSSARGSASAPVADAAPEGVPDGFGAIEFPTLRMAFAATIRAGMQIRVIGFGELHARTDRPGAPSGDRASVPSALSRFTHDLFPAIADRTSDLVVETWMPAGQCLDVAVAASARVEASMRRPAETKSEIADLAKAARGAHVQPRAMRMTCDDYARLAPPDHDVDTVGLLDLTTRELARVTRDALAARGSDASRPWIAVYGGALHNDRFPEAGTEMWSYASAIDDTTHGEFAEIDLIVPEFAAADPISQRQPWFPLVHAADAYVHVWKRGERSWVFVLPRTP